MDSVDGDMSQIGSALGVSSRPVEPRIALAVMREHYGRDGTVSALGSEKDGNFHVRERDGAEFLLKIVNPHEPAGISDFQTMLLLHLEAADPPQPVQKLVRTSDGRADFDIALDEEGPRRVRLTTFMSGVLMRDLGGGPNRALTIGAALARLQLALDGFAHPCASHELIWDLQHADRLRALLPAIADIEKRRQLEQRLNLFEVDVAPVLGSVRRQVLHNDFSGDNILVDRLDPDRITGILDFGDAVETAIIIDVAVAAAYQLDFAAGDPLPVLQRVLSGFHAVRALSAEEIAVFYDLVVTRLVMRLAITEWRAARVPENRNYILRNTPRAWKAFDRLTAIPRAAALSAFKHIQHSGEK